MNATAMVGNYQENFNTLATANQLRAAPQDFTQLPWDTHVGEIRLNDGQALYFYGGRKALLTALNAIDDYGRIRAIGWGPLALFRAKRSVASGTKTKQLLMLTVMPDKGMPTGLQNLHIPFDETPVTSIRVHQLKPIIKNL